MLVWVNAAVCGAAWYYFSAFWYGQVEAPRVVEGFGAREWNEAVKGSEVLRGVGGLLGMSVLWVGMGVGGLVGLL